MSGEAGRRGEGRDEKAREDDIAQREKDDREVVLIEESKSAKK